MADVKISELPTNFSPADDDQLEKNDVSAGVDGTSKKITLGGLRTNYLDSHYDALGAGQAAADAHEAKPAPHSGHATTAALNAHIDDTDNPHSVAHSQLADKGTNTHAQIDAHIAAPKPHSEHASITEANVFQLSQTIAAAAASSSLNIINVNAGTSVVYLSPDIGGPETKNFYLTAGQTANAVVLASANSSGTINATKEFTVYHGGATVIGDATGGDTGGGTLNAKGFFEDGVALRTALQDTFYTEAESDARYLQAVVDDTDPKLGGVLNTAGNSIVIENDAEELRGAIGYDETNTAVGYVYTEDGNLTTDNAGAWLDVDGVTLTGTSVKVSSLVHSLDGGRQVFCAEDGGLYGVDPPPRGWTQHETDSTFYPDLGGGTGLNAWVPITGLNTTTLGDLEINDRVDIAVSLQVQETGGRAGFIEFAIGVDGSVPGIGDPAGGTAAVSAGFEGYINISWSTLTTGTFPTGTAVALYARAASGSHGQYQLTADGSTNAHEWIITTPGDPGAGGSGDVSAGANWRDGDIVYISSAAGKILSAQASAFPIASVARNDQAQQFTGLQTFENLDIKGTSDVYAELQNTAFTADQQRMRVEAHPSYADSLSINAYADNGTFVANRMRVFHAGGITVGNPSGGSQGAGSGNFQNGVYHNGVLVAGIPTGGTTGQVLSKVDGSDYNTEWTTPAGGSSNTLASRTWSVAGDVSNATLPGFFAMVASKLTLTTFRAQLQAGTCTVQVHVNGSPVGASQAVTTTSGSSEVTLTQLLTAATDLVTLVVTAASGASGLTCTLDTTRAP